MRLVSLACCLLALAALPAAAQDPAKVASQYYRVVAENERVRVLHVTLPAGAAAAMHSHPAHVAVALDDGTVQVTSPEGTTREAPMKAGEALMTPAGAHKTANKGGASMGVIVIELKGEPGTATMPSSRKGMKMARILEDPRVDVFRVSMDPSFREPAGSTHEFDQVVIPLGPGDNSLTVDGKTTASWKKGDVALIGRGVPHESHAGKMRGDFIIVAVK
jgi:quercetin dioxygenase-like cupin family protein